MDIAAASASAAPWIAVGVLLGVAALLLTGLGTALVLRRRDACQAADPDPPPAPVDDLPDFLESPPGSAAPASSAAGGHVPLAAPAAPPPPPAPPEPRRAPTSAMAAAAGLAALLVVVAAVVALVSAAPPADRDGRAGRPAGAARPQPPTQVRMTFAGLVLHERAVGVTATYPEVELTADRDGSIARLTLPTWNCLSAEAPADPEAAGCVRSRTEHAELREPELEVIRDGDGVRFGGAFPSSTRPTGSPPEATGRTYRIQVTVTADDQPQPGRRSPASGLFALDGRETESVEGELRLDD